MKMVPIINHHKTFAYCTLSYDFTHFRVFRRDTTNTQRRLLVSYTSCFHDQFGR